jgi:hypothetical protein
MTVSLQQYLGRTLMKPMLGGGKTKTAAILVWKIFEINYTKTQPKPDQSVILHEQSKEKIATAMCYTYQKAGFDKAEKDGIKSCHLKNQCGYMNSFLVKLQ